MAKILTLLVLLMTAVTGAVAQTPELLVTIESRQNSDFTFGSMTFGGKAIVTFSNNVLNIGDEWGWYASPNLGAWLTVTSVEGYTITSCKFYTESSGTAVNGYTVEGESPSVYLFNMEVFTDDSKSVSIGTYGITKIEVYGYEGSPEPAGPTESIDLTTTDNLTWTLASMPGYDVELEVEYFALAILATTPAAAEGVVEGTDAALLTPGTSAEGTLAYAIGTSEAPTGQWSDAIPTAQGLEAGTCYVWYKVVGDAEHSDSQPQCIPVTIAQAPAYAVTIDDAGKDTDNWQATPAEPKTGQTVTLSYGGKKKIRSITIEAAPTAPAGPTLAETMTTAGMTVKVNYNYADEENYCLFVSNDDGTYTFQSGDGYVGGDANCAKALVVEGGKLVFKQNVFGTIDSSWDDCGFSVTFDTSNNTYSEWFGEMIKDQFNPSFTSVEVNGTTIAVTAAQ